MKPKAGADGSFPVDKAQAISGEKLLRNIMLDNKIELYAAYATMTLFSKPKKNFFNFFF